MKIAIIKTGGKQYLIEEGKILKVEKLDIEEGKVIKLDTLLIADDKDVEIGTPLVKSKVEAKVIRHARSRKVTGVKYKPKTRQSTSYGHRQHFTEIEIVKI
jgi:large subunit ribosomal protein L21